MKSEAAAKAVMNKVKPDAVDSQVLVGVQHNGKPGIWCDTCEWKILAKVVVGVAAADAIFMFGQSADIW